MTWLVPELPVVADCFWLILSWLTFYDWIRLSGVNRNLRTIVGQHPAYRTALDQGDCDPDIDQCFRQFCMAGHLEFARTLWDRLTEPFEFRTWAQTCGEGHLTMAQWLFRRPDIRAVILSSRELNQLFRDICTQGNLLMTEWFTSLGVSLSASPETFYVVCQNGYLEMAQWLWALYSSDLVQDMNNYFIVTCQNGHVKVAKWLIRLGVPLDITAHDYSAFLKSCQLRSSKMAKWLIRKSPEMPAWVYDSAFRRCCGQGSFKLAQWLIRHHEISSSVQVSAFGHSCYHGRLPIAQWLWSRNSNEIDIHYDQESIFTSACERNKLEVVQWLCEISGGTIDLHAREGWYFSEVCCSGFLAMAQWLYSLDPTIYPLEKVKEMTIPRRMTTWIDQVLASS